MKTKNGASCVVDVGKVSEALGPVSALAYSPPHDYPMSVPKFSVNSCIDLDKPPLDQLRLYVHIPFCNYACSFCFFSKNIGATRDQMVRNVRSLKKELDWIQPGLPLSQLFVGGGTSNVSFLSE